MLRINESPFLGRCPLTWLASAILFSCGAVFGQTAAPPPDNVAGIPVSYDEAKVGAYTLPDPLVLQNGQPVRDTRTWRDRRRPEIVRLAEENQYGRSPGRPPGMRFDVFDKGTPALNGTALRRQVTIYFSKDRSGPRLELAVYLPAGAKKPVPLLLNISFSPNSSTIQDPDLKPGEMWGRDRKKAPAPKGRGMGGLRIENLLARGFGVATFYYGDLDPDFAGGLRLGLGSEPRFGLPGDRPGRGLEARRHHRRVAPGKDRGLGRRP